MKSLFPGYYTPSDSDFLELWQQALFSFDANVLLNFYKFSPPTRNLFFNILEHLQDRIWLPYQSALEYHKHILDRIYDQIALFSATEVLSNLEKLNALAHQFRNHPIVKYESVLEIVQSAQGSMNSLISDQRAVEEYWSDCEQIKDRLSRLFTDRVGPAYSEQEQKEKFALLKNRYEKKIPPGFEDAMKPEPDRYGDGVLWFQLLDHAAKNKKAVVFVTDDKKDDWWLRKGGKDAGPRPELINEFFACVGERLYIYKSEQFIHFAKTFTKISDSEDLVERAAQELSQMSLVESVLPAKGEQSLGPDYSGFVNCPNCHLLKLEICDGTLKCSACEYSSREPSAALSENIVRIPISRPRSYLDAEKVNGCCSNSLLRITARDKKGMPYERCQICFSCGEFKREYC